MTSYLYHTGLDLCQPLCVSRCPLDVGFDKDARKESSLSRAFEIDVLMVTSGILVRRSPSTQFLLYDSITHDALPQTYHSKSWNHSSRFFDYDESTCVRQKIHSLVVKIQNHDSFCQSSLLLSTVHTGYYCHHFCTFLCLDFSV
jgi:hypothetical protein